MKKKTLKTPKKRTENQILQDEFLASIPKEQMVQVLDVLNILFKTANLPTTRRGAYFAIRTAKIAAFERIELTGFDQTMRVLDVYLMATSKGEPYRPTFNSATVTLTTGWQKILAFVDTYKGRNKGAISIGDSSLREKIAHGLTNQEF